MHSKKALLDQDHAKIIIGSYIALYNNQRLHNANAYITPADQLAGRLTKYTKKGGKRFMWQDSKENKMFSEMRSN